MAVVAAVAADAVVAVVPGAAVAVAAVCGGLALATSRVPACGIRPAGKQEISAQGNGPVYTGPFLFAPLAVALAARRLVGVEALVVVGARLSLAGATLQRVEIG